MIITSRFTSTCGKCGLQIQVGEQIWYTKRGNRYQKAGRALHQACYDPTATTSTESNSSNHDETTSDYTREMERDVQKTVDRGTVHTEAYHNGTYHEALKSYTGHDGHVRTDSATETLTKALKELIGVTPIDDKAVRDIFKQETQSLSGDLLSLIADEVSKIQTPAVTVTVKNERTGETKDMGVQHKQFSLLVKILASGESLNVWMTGPAGSGKTTAAHNAANALGLKFYFCGAQSNEYGLLGFRDASGATVRTLFREAYENGGVFLFDEIDASAPSAVLAFNAALANGVCAFPDAVVTRHADFVCIAAANTFGLGATNDYVGRMKQDAAFIDRFVFLSWELDETLESATCADKVWVKHVQKIRANAKSKGIKVIISPRASYYGAKLLAQGIERETVELLALRKGMDDTQWASVN